VLQGRIVAIQGERRWELAEGDSFHWDGSLPHRIENHGATTARLLVARTPPGFLNVTVYEAHAEPARRVQGPRPRRRARRV
jgi:hypothetical protein